MSWSKMGSVPNPIFDENGDPYSGAVLKAYLPGTTTSTSIAIDSSGSSPQASLTANAEGIWEVSGNEVIPHIDRECKWGIFDNATYAAANTPFYMGPFDEVLKVIEYGGTTSIPLSYATLTAAIADVGDLNIGDTVICAERTAGNGGGATWDCVDATTVTENEVNIVTGDATKSFTLRQENIFNVSKNGVERGTSSDQYSKLNTIIGLMTDGNTLFFPPGETYRSDSPLIATGKAINVIGYGATLDFSNNTTPLATALIIKGALTGTTTTATAAILQGAESITVASEADFDADNWMTISSDSELLGQEAGYLKGELTKITSTAANTINIEIGGTKDSYSITTETVTLAEAAMIDRPSVRGLKILGSGTQSHKHIGLAVSYAVKPIIKDVTIVDCSATGMDFNTCTDGLMEGCHVDNCNDVTSPLGYSYSFSLYSQHCTVDDCSATKFRHAFTTGGYYPVWNWKVTGSDFHNQLTTSTYMVGTHSNAVNGEVSNCQIDSGYWGIGITGARNTAVDNTVTNINTAACINFSFDGAIGGKIKGNTVEGVAGISVSGNDTTDDVTHITNNTIKGVSVNGTAIGSGITCLTQNCIVKDNVVNNHSHGIRVAGNSSDVDGNSIYNTHDANSPYAISVLSGTGSKVRNNVTRNPAGNTYTDSLIIYAAATDTIVQNNDFTGASGGEITDAGTDTLITNDNVLDGKLRGMESFTSTELNDISDAVNTNANRKNLSTVVLNSTLGYPVRPINSNANGVWVDMAGTTRNTPV